MIQPSQNVEGWQEEMWLIYQQYYYVPKEYFMQKIAGFTYQALYFSGEKLVGFMGVKVERGVEIDAKVYTLMGFGTVVIDAKYRHNGLVQRTVTRLYISEKWKNPFANIYLWTFANTYKPYLIFARHLKIAYPTYKKEVATHEKNLIESIGARYSNNSILTYYPNTGFVGFYYQNNIIDECKEIKKEDLIEPNIRYFYERKQEIEKMLPNKNLCLITIAPANLGNLIYSFFRRINFIKT